MGLPGARGRKQKDTLVYEWQSRLFAIVRVRSFVLSIPTLAGRDGTRARRGDAGRSYKTTYMAGRPGCRKGHNVARQ